MVRPTAAFIWPRPRIPIPPGAHQKWGGNGELGSAIAGQKALIGLFTNWLVGQRMLLQSRNVFICVIGLILAAISFSHAVDEGELGEAEKASSLVQDDAASRQHGDQLNSQGLSMDISPEQIDRSYETVDDNEQNSARVARITSCYQASVGRYQSEERGAITNTFSESARFDSAMTHFTARRDSWRQFDSCSRF